MEPKTENRKPKTMSLFGVPISITSKSGALAIITRWVTESKKRKAESEKGIDGSNLPSRFLLHASRLRPKVVVTPNPEMIVAAQRDPEFLRALQGADLAIPDGIGVVLAMRLLEGKSGKRKAESGKGIKDANFPSRFTLHASRLKRISGLSLMEDLISLAAQLGWRVMLVGGRSGAAERAAEQLRSGINLPSRFTLHAIAGPQDISHAPPHDLDHLITSINKIKPDLLFVAFGHGKQEKWLSANRDRLHAGVAMGVGGALDQIADPSLRPPAIIYSIGLGWLYRLIREPWRWRRQLALAQFATMVLRVFVRRTRLADAAVSRRRSGVGDRRAKRI